jgi:TPR repeat protein
VALAQGVLAALALAICTTASAKSPVRTPAPATNVQIDWEHCLLSVLHRYKKAGVEPTSALDQTCVGLRFLRGYDGPKNPARATPYFQRAANAGNATAQALLANALLKGHGVQPDVPRALKLLRQAADLGQTDAMLTLGEIAFQGTYNQPQDRRAAREWVRAAADRGNRAAWLALQQVFGPEAQVLDKASVLYRASQAQQAWPLFEKAARAGNIRAQFQVGWQLARGEGVAPDPAAAAGWYRKAADQGDGEAAAALGQLMEDGKGQAENWIDAAKWYRRSADLGDPMGTFFYGRAYQCGIGVPQNRNDAIEWFWRAEARGHPEGGRWGRWLRGVGNDIGVCSQRERDTMGMLSIEPVGRSFRNSAERLAWLGQTHVNFERASAWIDWDRRQRNYANCGGGQGCIAPGPEPPRP